MSNSAVQTVEQEQRQVAATGPQATSDASALMTIIERISGMPDLDLDRVERLFDMHQKMIDRQQEQAFNNAMARAQSDIQSVVVNQKNSHTGSSYADIDAIHESAKPIWTNHGFSVLTRTGRSDLQGHVKVFCEVRHSSGHKEQYEDDWPLDVSGSQGKANKTAIQGKGSTITYARRYTELMIFDIAIKGEDKDGNRQQQPKCVTGAQIKKLRDAAKDAGKDDAYICRKAQIARIEDLQQARLAGAINHLKGLAQGGAK